MSAIGQIFIGVNGVILKNNLAVWSHWLTVKWPRTLDDDDEDENDLKTNVKVSTQTKLSDETK